MPRGDKSAYTAKQRRQAEHIVESYEARGVNVAEAQSRAWATVNKTTGGGKQSGSGRAEPGTGKSPPVQRSPSAKTKAAKPSSAKARSA